nr:retrovirus-related Pol polyprotein from transposon TNT 1-94 [Tanacetum cinerariifolium]
MVSEMHKEDQQATGDPKSLGVTSEERANPLLSSDKDEVYAITNDETKDTLVPKSSSPRNKAEAEAEAALLRAQPSFPNMGQLNELLVKSLQIEFSMILSAHDFSSSLLTELKELPSKFNELTKEVKGLKKQVHNLEIELPGELKEIPTKLEDFTKTIDTDISLTAYANADHTGCQDTRRSTSGSTQFLGDKIVSWSFKKQKSTSISSKEEDFVYQAENRKISSARKEHMPYLQFTKVIISHFISKYKTISMRNRINLHTTRDDSLLEPVKKAKRVKRPAKKSTTAPTAGVVIRDTPAQLKKPLKKSRQNTHKLQASGSSDGANFESEVPYESKAKPSNTSEGTDESIDDNNDDNANDDDSENKDDDGSDVHDSERTESGAEHEKERKGNAEMTYANQNVSQEKSYEQVVKDAYNRQEESSIQAPSLFNVPETAIPETSTAHATTIPLTISMITSLLQLTTPSPALTTILTATLILALLDFSSLFGFDERVSTLETELSQLKQADHSAKLLESVKYKLPTMVDDLLSTRIRYATRTALESYTKETEKKAQKEKNLYIDVVEKSVKEIIKDKVKSLLPQILPKEVSYFATLVIWKEPMFETADTKMPQDQGGDTEDQPNIETTPMDD